MLERMVTLIHFISSNTVLMLPLQLPEIKTEIKNSSTTSVKLKLIFLIKGRETLDDRQLVFFYIRNIKKNDKST